TRAQRRRARARSPRPRAGLSTRGGGRGGSAPSTACGYPSHHRAVGFSRRRPTREGGRARSPMPETRRRHSAALPPPSTGLDARSEASLERLTRALLSDETRLALLGPPG